MTIPYTIDKYHLKNNDSQYVARVQSWGTADMDEIVDRILARGSTLTRSDVIAVLSLMRDVCIDLVLDGQRVNLAGLVHLYCSIGNSFHGPQDRFDRSRHELRGTATPGTALNAALQHRGKPRKQEPNRLRPDARSFTDLLSDTSNTLSAGGVGRLSGTRLKFNPAADDEGIFLIDAAKQERRLDKVFDNTPRELLFAIPQVPAGTCSLEVRSRVGNAQTITKSRLPHPLTVANSDT